MNAFDPGQRGLALVIVLILLLVMTLIGSTAISTTQQQERISAHQRQHAHALYAAEFGLERAAAILLAVLKDGLTAPEEAVWGGSEIIDQLGIDWVSADAAEPYGAGDFAGYFIDEIRFAGGGVQITAAGRTAGVARRQITSTFRIDQTPGGASPFMNPLTVCDSVQITGSGAIRSYDSLNPGAGEQYQAHVVVREAGGSVALQGASSIFGSVEGPADSGHFGGNLYGDFRINGNITTNSGTRVCGQVSTRANFTSSGNFNLGANTLAGCAAAGITESGITAQDIRLNAGSSVNGRLRAAGDLSTSGNTSVTGASHQVAGNVSRTGSSSIQTELAYGGSHNAQGNHQTGVLLNVPGLTVSLPPALEPQPCEPPGMSIHQIMSANLPQTDAVLHGNLPPMVWDSPDHLIGYLEDRGMDPGQLQDFDADPTLTFRITGSADLGGYRTLQFPAGKNIVLRIDGDIDLGGSARISIPADVDVTFYVGGDVNFGGSGSLELGNNATVTFFVRGNADLGNNPVQFQTIESVVQRADSQGNPILRPRLSYFSDVHRSNAPGHGDNIRVRGNSSLYGAFYAPEATLGLRGSGELRGSVWVHSAEITGNADIVYDIQLGQAQTGPGGGGGAGTRLVRAGWSEVIE